MKLIIELSENDYKALKDEGVQNHIALADTVIAHSVPYEEKPQGMWSITGETDEFYGLVYKCTHCGKEMLACDCHNFCTWCGARMEGGAE